MPAFLDAVLCQTRAPDEVLIVDAGSDDGTTELIRERIRKGAPIKLIVEPGANRSQGRNRGVQESSAEVIAITDLGARPRPDWFERIITPLEADPEIDVVGGYYEADPRTLWEAAVAAATVPAAQEVDPDSFLPSGRSVAFRRAAWEQAGGYPEWAWHNEDTPFGRTLRQVGAKFHFEPEALVVWRPRGTVGGLFVQFYRYARGDAQGRIWFRHYAKAYLVVGCGLALAIAGCFWPSALLGFPALVLAYCLRHALRARRRTARLEAVILAPLANLIVDLAHVVGYTRGMIEGRRNAT